MTHPRRLILIGALLGAILILLVGPRLVLGRHTVEQFMEAYFNGQVQIAAFDVSLWPTARAIAKDVVLRRHRATAVPPLITMERVTIEASFLGLLRRPRHLHLVSVEGLTIRVPPGSRRGEDRPGKDAGGSGASRTPLVVDHVVSDRARLEILPDEAGKQPLTFDLQHLDARSIATDRPLTFRTELVNPKPRGLISATGTFGPWDAGDEGLTRVSGSFTYRDVDLGTIGGIGGRLSAEGTFEGPLRSIVVRGRTHTPDFTVDVARQPIPLETVFDARVDGTNGNTYLDRVDAHFFNTSLRATGVVVDQPDPASRAVLLDVTIDEGRVEDVLRFALSSAPPLTGGLRLKTGFRLPGDQRDVIDKLELDGSFSITRAAFASESTRSKLGDLSARAQGRPEDGAEARVASDFKGRFRLKNGSLAFSDLEFAIPGATVHLKGTYALRSQALDLHGTLRLAAKLSETTSGWKSVLLKILDPVFSKGGKGSVVPIKVTGTARKPDFGVETGKVLKGK